LQKLGLSARQLGRMADELHGYFQQARPYLQADCNLAAVAAATGYSRNQLSYLLNQVLGQSFYGYVNQARLQHLLDHLPASGNVRMDELAFAAGFNSLSVFYRCFRQHTGLSPAAWLRRFPRGHAATTGRPRCISLGPSITGEPTMAASPTISLWMEQLGDSLSPRQALAGDIEADVAIVGAGYTGLWTAYYLKQQVPDLRVVVLEAEIAGFGASGRNGGWVIGEVLGEDRCWPG
jgi:AraC-like DNA-binding protein